MSEPAGKVERFLSPNERGTLKKCLKSVVLTAGGRTLGVNGLEFLQKLMALFEEERLPVKKAYLVGGFATYLMNTNYRYNDYDIVMPVELENPVKEGMTFTGISDSIEEIIRRNLQESDAQDCEGTSDQSKNPIDLFFAKKFWFNRRNGSTDSWSLFSLKAENGINLELKFVLSLARKYEFVTDSLAVDLMPLLDGSAEPMSYQLYCDGNINQNINIIRRLKIKILNPEQVSGGGFLKYCRLKSEGLKYYDIKANEATIIPPMARGFFLRYGTNVAAIKTEIEKYLTEHFKTIGIKRKNTLLDELFTVTNSNDVFKKQHCDRSMTDGSSPQNETVIIQMQIAKFLDEHFRTVGKSAKRELLEKLLPATNSIDVPRNLQSLRFVVNQPITRGSHMQYEIDAAGNKEEIKNYMAELSKVVIKEAKSKFLDEILNAANSIDAPINQHNLRTAVHQIAAKFNLKLAVDNP